MTSGPGARGIEEEGTAIRPMGIRLQKTGVGKTDLNKRIISTVTIQRRWKYLIVPPLYLDDGSLFFVRRNNRANM
jgi:hypothetical protein